MTTGALLEGHFLLTSGLHSARYVQCARVLQYPQHAETLGQLDCGLFPRHAIDVVISPAIGGIVIGHEVARALGVRAIFGEREGGVMTLRRGFDSGAGERVLVVEDVTTTGGSVREIIQVVQAQQGQCRRGRRHSRPQSGAHRSRRAIACAGDAGRSQNYAPEACPLCQQGSQAVKPGSRLPAAMITTEQSCRNTTVVLSPCKNLNLHIDAGRVFRFPGTEWCRQNHHHQNARGPAQAQCWQCHDRGV